jgi:sugar lactone lactonase YvrE
MRRHLATMVIVVLGGWGALAPGQAWAFRPLLSQAFLNTSAAPPEGQLEDPCGLAVPPSGNEIYVADYYHRVIDLFGTGGDYHSQIALPGGAISGLGINKLGGVCGLAVDSAGDLYANEWHEGVLRLLPSEFTLDTGESTGVAIDAAGDVFVDDRTFVAEYAAPVVAGEAPSVKIGLGTLEDGHGVAVTADGTRVYVGEAARGEVDGFETSGVPAGPVVRIAPPGGFTSLVDTALAIDPTDGHLLVVDNLEPGYEHPEAVVDEFDPGGAFVGQLRGPPGTPIIDGEPSGLALDAAGNLFVTTGNGELGNAFKFGPDPPGPPPPPPPGPSSLLVGAGTEAPANAPAASRNPSTTTPTRTPGRAKSPPRATASDVVQRGGVRVAVDADIAPRRLPRQGSAAIDFSLSAKISSTDGSVPPQLRRVSIEINRNGHLDPTGLPTCSLAAIQPATTAGALAACRRSLVGEGSFSAKVLIAQQAPFPSDGKILAFNGSWRGRPAILAHIYGESPVPTSYTLPFLIGSAGQGTYDTTLSASLPEFTSKWGYVTGISLELGRRSHFHGTVRSYLTAGCPAPAGFPGAVFPLSRATLGFSGNKPIAQTITRSCQAIRSHRSP